MLLSRPWILSDLRRRSDGSAACERLLEVAERDLRDDDRYLDAIVLWEWWVIALECYRRDPRPEVARGILDGEIDPASWVAS